MCRYSLSLPIIKTETATKATILGGAARPGSSNLWLQLCTALRLSRTGREELTRGSSHSACRL